MSHPRMIKLPVTRPLHTKPGEGSSWLLVNRFQVITVEPVDPLKTDGGEIPRCIVTLPTKAHVVGLDAVEVIRRLGFEIG